MSGEAGATPAGPQAFLAFRVATWRLALPLAEVRRVVPLPFLTPPLGAPHFVEGFFDFQGAPVAVIRLDRLFSLDDGQLGVYTPLIVLDVAGLAVGMHVARIDGILEVEASRIQAIGRDETFNACVMARISDKGETVYVVSRDELLLAEERAKIVAHQKMKEERLDDLATGLAHAS